MHLIVVGDTPDEMPNAKQILGGLADVPFITGDKIVEGHDIVVLNAEDLNPRDLEMADVQIYLIGQVSDPTKQVNADQVVEPDGIDALITSILSILESDSDGTDDS
jgi:hypothetical protein